MVLVRWARTKEFGPFTALLIALVFFIGLVPLVEEGLFSHRILVIGFFTVMVAGLGVARQNRGFLGIALALILTRFCLEWFADLVTTVEEHRRVPADIVAVAYCGYLIVVMLRTLSKQTETTVDIILGGINVYLLFALLFMFCHVGLETMQPGSYQRAGIPLSDPASMPYGSLDTTLFYFSFTTLTTLGYGDISPARPIAQFMCSAEAVIGQLYVAIFIGGLVALRISGLKRGSSAQTLE